MRKEKDWIESMIKKRAFLTRENPGEAIKNTKSLKFSVEAKRDATLLLRFEKLVFEPILVYCT